MKTINLFLLIFLSAMFFCVNTFAQTASPSNEKSTLITEAEEALNSFLHSKRSKAEKQKNRNELKGALGAAFIGHGKKDLSIIVETGTINSFVRQLPNSSSVSKNHLNFLTKSNGYSNLGGYSAGLKLVKNLSINAFDTKLSVDLISGLVYKYTQTHQHGIGNQLDISDGIIRCGIDVLYPMVRDIKTKSIEIPIEIRTTYHLNRFLISPTFGLGIDLPTSTNQTDYSYDFIDEEYVKKEITGVYTQKGGNTNFNLISKLDVAYLLPNNHKIRLSAFYSANIRDRIALSYSFDEGISSQGFQVSYEIPISNLKYTK